MSRKYEVANLYFSDIVYCHSDSLANTVLYLNILNNLKMEQWSEADSLLRKYIQINPSFFDSLSVDAIFEKPKLKNRKSAKIMSYIIPR
jgi:hypothetical protein